MRKNSFVNPEAFFTLSKSTRTRPTAQVMQLLKQKQWQRSPNIGSSISSRAVVLHFLESYMVLWRVMIMMLQEECLPFLWIIPNNLTLFGGVIEQHHLEEWAMAVSTSPMISHILQQPIRFHFFNSIDFATDKSASPGTLQHRISCKIHNRCIKIASRGL